MGAVCCLLTQLILRRPAIFMDERRIHCTHCGGLVSKKTFLAHKRVYYDSNSDQWVKRRELDPESKLSLSLSLITPH